eukprot:Rhum_TRINITY_DN14613_c34_g1::Rhum_TRINITY_DN14613_c34_g1_i1::g.109200::m.109200
MLAAALSHADGHGADQLLHHADVVAVDLVLGLLAPLRVLLRVHQEGAGDQLEGHAAHTPHVRARRDGVAEQHLRRTVLPRLQDHTQRVRRDTRLPALQAARVRADAVVLRVRVEQRGEAKVRDTDVALLLLRVGQHVVRRDEARRLPLRAAQLRHGVLPVAHLVARLLRHGRQQDVLRLQVRVHHAVARQLVEAAQRRTQARLHEGNVLRGALGAQGRARDAAGLGAVRVRLLHEAQDVLPQHREHHAHVVAVLALLREDAEDRRQRRRAAAPGVLADVLQKVGLLVGGVGHVLGALRHLDGHELRRARGELALEALLVPAEPHGGKLAPAQLRDDVVASVQHQALLQAHVAVLAVLRLVLLSVGRPRAHHVADVRRHLPAAAAGLRRRCSLVALLRLRRHLRRRCHVVRPVRLRRRARRVSSGRVRARVRGRRRGGLVRRARRVARRVQQTLQDRRRQVRKLRVRRVPGGRVRGRRGGAARAPGAGARQRARALLLLLRRRRLIAGLAVLAVAG